MLSGLPSPALANHMWCVDRWLNSPCSPHMIRSFFLSPARDLSAPRSRTYLVFFLSSALRHRERHLSGGLDCEGASVLQRGLTARSGICAIVYTQSILPCSTRLWHKLTSVRAEGQKKECSTRSVGFGVYRRQTPVYTITLFFVGRTPITANPKACPRTLCSQSTTAL